MLIALLPDQISEYWHLLKPNDEMYLPPIADWGPYDTNRLLVACQVGMMQAWMVADKGQKAKGFLLTTILNDVSGVLTLLVYSAVVLENGGIGDWVSCYDTLKRYAVSKGCSKIAAFISNEKILAMLKEEADAETRFVFAHINL